MVTKILEFENTKFAIRVMAKNLAPSRGFSRSHNLTASF